MNWITRNYIFASGAAGRPALSVVSVPATEHNGWFHLSPFAGLPGRHEECSAYFYLVPHA